MAPLLLLLKGQPGSGKSTLAAALAAALCWPLIDKDDARSSFQHLVAGHPDIDWNELSYGVMFRHAETQLRVGLSLIIDCPLARLTLWEQAAALAAQYGAHIALVELVPCNTKVWRQRIEQRGQQDSGTEHEHKPGSWADVQAIMARNCGSENWSVTIDIPLRCRLDSTTGSTDQHVAEVLHMLQQVGVQPAPAARAVAAAAAAAPQQLVTLGSAR